VQVFGIEPMEWAHQPKMMFGMGKFNQSVRKAHGVDERLKNLVELKGAQMIGCEFCVDLGSQICRNSGFSDEELLALPRYRHSDLFTEREKLALDYTVAVMRAGRSERPICPNEGALQRRPAGRDHCSATLVNLDRFNAAFGIARPGSATGWSACRRIARLTTRRG
jgi:AhpD family alkylhydroperoxidase